MEFDLNSIQSKARAVRDTQYMSITKKQADRLCLSTWKKVQREMKKRAEEGGFNYNLNIEKYLGIKASDSITHPGFNYTTCLRFELGAFLVKKLKEAGFKKVSTSQRCCNNTYCNLDGYNLYISWMEDEDTYYKGGKQRKNV